MPKKTPLRARTFAFLCAALLALVAGTYMLIKQAEKDALTAGAEQSKILARAFAEHTLASVRLIDYVLSDLAEDWSPESARVSRNLSVSHYIADMAVQVASTDAKGRLNYSNLGMPSTAMDLSDREHIKVHLEGTVKGLFISRPVKGRLSGKWTIQFSRAIIRNGRTEGVLVISVDPEYFARFYESLSLKSGDVVTMVRTTGEVMARFPASTQFFGQVISDAPYLEKSSTVQGAYRRLAVTDGVDRLYGWHRLSEYGLVLISGVSVNSALEEFRSIRLWVIAAATAVGTALILIFLSVLRTIEAGNRRATGLADSNRQLEERVEQRTADLSRLLAEKQALADFMAKILASSPAILITRRAEDGAITYVSPNVSGILGWSTDEVQKDPHFWEQQVHPQDVAALHADQDTLAQRQSQSRRYRMRRKDGQYCWLNEELSEVRHDNSALVEYVGACCDITEQTRLEEQLRETQKLEAIGQLTGGLAHDFNNLLGIVIGNLDLIGEHLPAEPGLQRQHTAALDAALRGAQVTRALLAVARRQPMQVEAHDVNRLIDEMLPLIRSSAGSSVTVNAELSPLPLIAPLDAGGFNNVVLNLTINARDAMRSQTRRQVLTVGTKLLHIGAGGDAELSPGRYAVLEISDTGCGMSDTVRAHAFEPFFTTKDRNRGTGLGLSMVYGYAEQLGGTARIQSSSENGTTIQVFLPLKSKPDSRASEDSADWHTFREAPRPPLPEAQPAGGSVSPAADTYVPRTSNPVNTTTTPDTPALTSSRRSALVVDDEQTLCDIACEWLEALGYSVVGAHSPDEALQKLAQQQFNLLLTDVVMPGPMDGVGLAAIAQQMQPGIRILLASGYARSLIDAKNLPGPLLNKPYRKNDLAAALRALEPGTAPQS